jgi:hypothetical protein
MFYKEVTNFLFTFKFDIVFSSIEFIVDTLRL